MPVAEMLVDSAVGFDYLSMLDEYSSYNQIFIAEEDVSKTSFRCPGALGLLLLDDNDAFWIRKCWCLLPKINEFNVS